jgi:hypothetical protein
MLNPNNIYCLHNLISPCRRLALFLLCLSAFAATEAQVAQPHRFEKKQRHSDAEFSIITLKEEGLALLREKNKYNGNKQMWELILLDTALQERKNVELEINQRYPLIGYEYVKGSLFLLYRTGDNNRNSFEMAHIDLAEGFERKRYEIKPELDFKVTHFSKVGGNMVMGGYVSNEPAVILFSLDDNQIKVIPGFFQKDNELVDLRVNQNRTFNAVLIDRSLKSERKLVFRTFDETGSLLMEDVVPIDADRSLQVSISSTLEREDLLVTGTWGDKQGKQSSGFFSLPVDPFNEQKINYISFGELQHFTDYLNPKRAERIKANAKADVEAGRKPSFVEHVIPYRLEEHQQGFLLHAEVYHPVNASNPNYNSLYNTSPYYNPYYNPYLYGYYPGMRLYRPFMYGDNIKNQDEFKIYSSSLIAFDAKGKRLWDQSFKLEDSKRRALEQVADYCYTNNSTVHFIYKKESELNVKVIDVNDGSAKESTQKLKLSDPLDENRSDREAGDGVRHWIGNSFYVWGYQTIRNNQHTDDRVRDVFFINKVVVK